VFLFYIIKGLLVNEVVTVFLGKKSLLQVLLFNVTACILFPSLPSFATTETILHTFTGGSDANSSYPLVLDSSGNLYGTTQAFGGEVFQLAPNGSGGWNYQVLYSFSAPNQCNTDGCYPVGALTLDNSGNIYGVNGTGGANGAGTVFQLSKDSKGNWSYGVIDNFGPEFSGDGYWPRAGVVYRNGVLYGTTSYGGAYDSGCVFSLTLNQSGGWSEALLHSFANDSVDGVTPMTPVIFDPQGSIYGTTSHGGPSSEGTVYELSANGSAWSEQILFNFTSSGYAVEPSALAYFSGRLYGSTAQSGQYNFGSIYQLSPSAGSWTQTILYNFAGGKGGAFPNGMVIDSRGGIFVTTSMGGGSGVCKLPPDPQNWYCGAVFLFTPTVSGTWKATILYRFGNSHGSNPTGLILDGSENMYGTTYTGGTAGTQYGVVFKLLR
jgi:uncharacterized repeat protein (TIGR03803 family)